MRTNIMIDETLMRKARKLTTLKTKREVVERALQLLVQVGQQEAIRKARGKLRWSGSLSTLRADR